MSKNVKIKSNFEIHKDENCIIVSINPKIYSLDVIYSAAYVFLDRAYIIMDGDPEDKIVIEIRPKEKGADLEVLGREFSNELLNYSVYKAQSDRNATIRQMVIQRALFTNDSELEGMFIGSEDEKYEEDPEGIAIPWEEKFGVKDEKSKRGCRTKV